MNRFNPMRVVTFSPRAHVPEATALFDLLSGSRAHSRVMVLPPGASFTVIAPEPGGLRTFRPWSSLGLGIVPAPVGAIGGAT